MNFQIYLYRPQTVLCVALAKLIRIEVNVSTGLIENTIITLPNACMCVYVFVFWNAH